MGHQRFFEAYLIPVQVSFLPPLQGALARSNPSTQVIGIDLSAIQSTATVPTHCQSRTVNVDKDWGFPKPFDFIIHSRLLLFGMHDWPCHFRWCFINLKAGGWVEAQEVSAGRASALMRMGDLIHDAMSRGQS